MQRSLCSLLKAICCLEILTDVNNFVLHSEVLCITTSRQCVRNKRGRQIREQENIERQALQAAEVLCVSQGPCSQGPATGS